MTLPACLRPKVVIKKWDASQTYFVHDPFSPLSSGARVLACSVEDQELVAAPFMIRIEDAGGALDANVGCGNKVTTSIGTTQGGLTPYVTGYVRRVEINRKDTNLKEITLHGLGSVIRLDERIGNFYRIANRAANGVDPDNADPAMTCSEIFKDIFEDLDHMPLGQPAEPFTTTGVREMGEHLASIKQPFVEWKQIADRAAEASGSVYGIDAGDAAFMHYPTLTHSGITIKGVPAEADVDAATGYFLGAWNYRDSILKSDGFANRLYGRGGTQLLLDVDKFTDSASIECYSKDRAIQFTARAPRLDAVALILSRTGTLSADIAGEIRLDDGNTPDGEAVGTFSVFKNLVGESATTINRVNTSMYSNALQVDKKYWLVIKKAGDASNHLKWHHDSGSSAVNAERDASTWTINASSYAPAHRTYFSRRVLAEASDQISIDRYNVIEAVQDAPWIKERQTMDTYLTSILQYSALRHRIYDVKRIYAPSTPINAGRLVRLVDPLSGVNADAEVVLSRYHFNSDENGLGTRFAEVQLQAYVR